MKGFEYYATVCHFSLFSLAVGCFPFVQSTQNVPYQNFHLYVPSSYECKGILLCSYECRMMFLDTSTESDVSPYHTCGCI